MSLRLTGFLLEFPGSRRWGREKGAAKAALRAGGLSENTTENTAPEEKNNLDHCRKQFSGAIAAAAASSKKMWVWGRKQSLRFYGSPQEGAGVWMALHPCAHVWVGPRLVWGARIKMLPNTTLQKTRNTACIKLRDILFYCPTL